MTIVYQVHRLGARAVHALALEADQSLPVERRQARAAARAVGRGGQDWWIWGVEGRGSGLIIHVSESVDICSARIVVLASEVFVVALFRRDSQAERLELSIQFVFSGLAEVLGCKQK